MNVPVYMILTAIMCLGSELASGLAALGIILLGIEDLFEITSKEVER